jgi:hypothetical protein
MMQCANDADVTAPSSLAMRTAWSLVKLAVPRTTDTLRCFASAARPPVKRPTTLSFHWRNAFASIFGAPNSMPCEAMAAASSITFAACSSAFEGMHPTLRHTPPSVGQRSTSATLSPRSAARNAAV